MADDYFEFFGSDLSADDCDLLALAHIPAEARKDEASLFDRKWFDYRHLHPVQATYLYAAQYQKAIEAIYAETKDIRTVGSIKAFEPEDIFKGRELLAFWFARQACDRVGCRYEFALRFIMRRFADRGWHIFPRPNQCYSLELVLDIQDAWKAECATKLQFPRHPRFKNPEFVGHDDQVAYRQWLIDQIKERGAHMHRGLSRALSEGCLTKEEALEAFGESVVRRAAALIVA